MERLALDEKERFKYTIRRVDHGVDMMPFPPEVMKHLEKIKRKGGRRYM